MAAPKSGKGGLRSLSLHDLYKLDLPARDFLLHPWLRQGESAMLWAAPGIGKKMFALTVALAVASGGGFLDYRVSKPRKVLFVDGEMSVTDLRDRCRMLQGTIVGGDAKAAGVNAGDKMHRYAGVKMHQ